MPKSVKKSNDKPEVKKITFTKAQLQEEIDELRRAVDVLSNTHPQPEIPPTLRQMLHLIDRFVYSGYKGIQLYQILTALRGPDNDNRIAKRETTGKIRQTVFPLSASIGRLGVTSGGRVTTNFEYDEKLGLMERHFVRHIEDAVSQLRQEKYDI